MAIASSLFFIVDLEEEGVLILPIPSINFEVKHLGYSWLTGRFNEFSGEFTYDPKNVAASTINVTINTNSVDSNHAERDKHLRSDDFLNVEKYPTTLTTMPAAAYKRAWNRKKLLPI